jgi:hypothetical protein
MECRPRVHDLGLLQDDDRDSIAANPTSERHWRAEAIFSIYG